MNVPTVWPRIPHVNSQFPVGRKNKKRALQGWRQVPQHTRFAIFTALPTLTELHEKEAPWALFYYHDPRFEQKHRNRL